MSPNRMVMATALTLLHSAVQNDGHDELAKLRARLSLSDNDFILFIAKAISGPTISPIY